MNVQTLLEELQSLIRHGAVNPTDEVYLAQPTHDHWGAVKAVCLSEVDLAKAAHSDYHNGLVVDDEADDSRAKTILFLN